MEIRPGIGLVDDPPEPGIVDALLALIRGQRDRRLIEGFPRHDVITAGKILAIAPQVDARKDHLRAGRADVNADAHERHMVLLPDRILFQRTVVIKIEMIVVVVAVFVVFVDDILAIEMVGEVVPARWFPVFGFRHQNSLLNRSKHPGRRSPSACRMAHSTWPHADVGGGEAAVP